MSTIWTRDTGRGFGKGFGRESGNEMRRESGSGAAMAPSQAGVMPAGLSSAAPTPAPARAESPAPPLHAALDYCARRLLAALDASDSTRVQAGTPLAAQLTPASDSLLRWWFSSDTCKARADNFHFAQRESILHTILAYELLHSDDPAQLYRSACGPPPITGTCCTDAARYRLRLAPGGGGRWVVQALLVWWWANAVARADDNALAANESVLLIAATPGIGRNLHEALFGHADRDAAAGVDVDVDVDRGSLLRHARLFLPPALRQPFRDWLRMQSTGSSASLRITEAPGTYADSPALTLIARSGTNADAASSRPDTGMQVDVMLSGDPAAAIVDAPLDRMIQRGAAKLPMLEATATLRLPPLRHLTPRTEPPRRCGLRPHLSRCHPALLRAGIDALRRREPGFATLDPARRPRLLVLCDAPTALQAARRFLIDRGFSPASIAIGGDHACRDDIRAVIDTLPVPRSTLADARICVVVALRTHRSCTDPLTVVGAGAAPLWPEPDFAEARTENRERAVHRRAPQNLIDVLSVIEHPQCHAAYASLLRAGLCAHGAHAGRRTPDRRDAATGAAVIDPAIDDLAVVALREHAADFDLALPLTCADAPPHAERLSDLPRRVLRMRHALAVRKSIHTHACCDVNDSGLRRAFLECAESDPEIESHDLIDPRRHAATSREAWLAQGFATRVWPEAVVRTADRVYLVNFQPFCPTRRPPPDAAERMFAHWLRRANALPAAERQDRIWCRATLAAPLFWSWKRSDARLSALLSELADAEASTRRDDIIV